MSLRYLVNGRPGSRRRSTKITSEAGQQQEAGEKTVVTIDASKDELEHLNATDKTINEFRNSYEDDDDEEDEEERAEIVVEVSR